MGDPEFQAWASLPDGGGYTSIPAAMEIFARDHDDSDVHYTVSSFGPPDWAAEVK